MRKEVNVRRVIPLVRNVFVYRHPAVQGELKAISDVGKVWIVDDYGFADAHHLAQKDVGLTNLLERSAKNDVVITPRGVIFEPLVEIAVEHADTFAHTGLNRMIVDVDAAPANVALFYEALKERAIVTSEVENRTSRSNDSDDLIKNTHLALLPSIKAEISSLWSEYSSKNES